MALVPFNDWWGRVGNQQDFWRTYQNGVAISLGETPRNIFRQILQRLKEYHDRNVGYGSLREGVLIGENKQVFLANDGSNPNSPLEPLASIRQDFLDFKYLVTWFETQISTEQPPHSSEKFHDLFLLLNDARYNGTVDGLRRFGFFIRNNPLFYDDAAKYLFFKKVLTILEYSETDFRNNVQLGDLQGWSEDVHVRNPHLRSVREFRTRSSRNPTNQSGGTLLNFLRTLGEIFNLVAARDMRHGRPRQSTYSHPVESIRFFRNCFGHLRDHYRADRYHDAKILLALEDDLPMVIPVWFHDLVRRLDLDELTCINMCGYSWMEFLSEQPSVFT